MIYCSRNTFGIYLIYYLILLTDDGEQDQTSPIFSFSLGLSCIFLIGSNTKDDKPLAIRIDSGDLLIMGGEARRSWHGVPRILGGSFQREEFEKHLSTIGFTQKQLLPNTDQTEFENDFRHALNYLQENRINLNFRQVLANPTERHSTHNEKSE